MGRYIIPEIITYVHHAYPLGIIQANENAWEWILNNYIYVYKKPNERSFNFLVQYYNNPFLEIRNIHKYEYCSIMKSGLLHEWIKMEVNNGGYVQIAVDYFYIKKAKTCGKEHIMHEMLIVDWISNKYLCWDYVDDLFVSFSCEKDEIVLYETDDYYGTDIVAKIYTPKAGTYHWEIANVLRDIKNYYSGKNPWNEIAIWGDYCEYRNYNYGMGIIKTLAHEISQMDFIDYRYISLFYEHKKLMYKRLFKIQEQSRLFPEALFQSMLTQWKELEITWSKLRYLALQHNVSPVRRKKAISERITTEIRQLADIEEKILYKMIQYM